VTAAGIAAALGAAQCSGKWWRCPCPAHNSGGATLALRDGDGGLIVHCHAGCGRDQVIAELCRRGLLIHAATSAKPPDPAEIERRRAADERDRNRRIAEALDFWQQETEAARPNGTVERYWTGRALALPMPPTIRASRSWLRHAEGGSRPVMVALVEHVADGPVAIHRTWLAVDGSGKASFREPRRGLGPVNGGAVQLAPAGKLLMVGEGIETTAAAMTATGLPGWAALSAGGIEALILPPLPLAETVVILADNDENGRGERAARTAARRWLGERRRVRIAMPPEPNTDMADVLAGRTYPRITELRDVAA
jgi:putative DNA primase/helicase